MIFRYLNMTLDSSSGIRQQDAQHVISAVSANVIGRDLTFDFVRSNWDGILKL